MSKYFEKMISIERFKTCFEANYKGPYNFTGEFHPFWEMVYVIDGCVNVSGDERIYTLTKGDIIFHKPMEFHRLWSKGKQDIHALIISFQASGVHTKNLEGRAMTLEGECLEMMEGFLTFLRRRFDNGGGNFAKNMRSTENNGQVQIAQNLLENFLLSLPTDNLMPIKREKESVSETYRMIITELSANVYGWITIDELAKKCNFSTAQIKRVFAKYSDIGIHKYFLKLKIATAIKMLGDGHEISDISRILGFSSQNYFSGAFKRETGYSPTAYREKMPKI